MFIYLKKYNIKNKYIFLIGGSIRDKKIKNFFLEKDWLIINANIKLIYNFKLVGKNFPVFLHPVNKEEYSLAREYYSISKIYDKILFKFSYFSNIKHDLLNRDLIINTLILSKNGFVIDIFNAKNNLTKNLIKSVSFNFIFDSIRIFRVIRFFIKYYEKKFIIDKELLILMQYLIFKINYLNFKIERILKEFFSSLHYKYSFLFFYLAYKLSILKHIFRNLHFLYLLSDLLKFNPYINFSKHILKIIYYLNYYTNNKQIVLTIYFFKLNYYKYLFISKNILFKYKRIKIESLYYYKKFFYLSKKNINFILYLSNAYVFYNNFHNKYKLIYKFIDTTNFFKNKIILINMFMIYTLEEKYNNIINKFYYKYFILDILNKISINKVKNNKKNIQNIKYNFIKKIITNTYNKYKNIYFVL